MAGVLRRTTHPNLRRRRAGECARALDQFRQRPGSQASRRPHGQSEDADDPSETNGGTILRTALTPSGANRAARAPRRHRRHHRVPCSSGPAAQPASHITVPGESRRQITIDGGQVEQWLAAEEGHEVSALIALGLRAGVISPVAGEMSQHVQSAVAFSYQTAHRRMPPLLSSTSTNSGTIPKSEFPHRTTLHDLRALKLIATDRGHTYAPSRKKVSTLTSFCAAPSVVWSASMSPDRSCASNLPHLPSRSPKPSLSNSARLADGRQQESQWRRHFTLDVLAGAAPSGRQRQQRRRRSHRLRD